MNSKENEKMSYFRISAALSCVGLFLTALLIGFLKKLRIYELEYEFGRSITVLFFIAVVALPLLYCASELCYNKFFRPLLYRYFLYRRQLRIEKYGYKVVLRKEKYQRRLNKVLGPDLACFALIYLCLMMLSLITALWMCKLLMPGFDFDDTPTIPLFILVCIVPITVTGFLCSIGFVRVFVKKKGKAKALKYAVNIKKKPGVFGSLWLKCCGFKEQDVRMYLDKLGL